MVHAGSLVMTKVFGALPPVAQRHSVRAVSGPACIQAVLSNMPGPTTVDRRCGVRACCSDPSAAAGCTAGRRCVELDGCARRGLAVGPKFLDAEMLAAAMEYALRELTAAGDVTEAESNRRHSASTPAPAAFSPGCAASPVPVRSIRAAESSGTAPFVGE